ncbi:MAG: glycoside hydrolase family 27 protein [Proteobacteria bacterium]|nr:glycoside hydrolase family 27 protein [Pseudomonadota bacterium]
MAAMMVATTMMVAATAMAGAPASAATGPSANTLAPTPPMGWNSWDAYGFTLTEADFKANATVLAQLRQFGWTYAVIDEGWYMGNPAGENLEQRDYKLDTHGLLAPSLDRFPSSKGGVGLAPLAAWTHAQGLKFGIHIVRGIPKQAVKDNVPITGSNFHANDAADTADVCPWDDGNYGVRDNAAGQAYYDSMLKLYADWGLDFIKVDCISDHPYEATEIRQIATAIKHSGRPIVLSLSPGPTQLSHAAEVAEYSQMWRISNDIWDGWSFTPAKPGDDFPNGVVTAFDNLAKWSTHSRPGNWPDADMLPWGALKPNPGWGTARQSRLTHDEQQTQFLLWSIARSPLILGANLTQLDEFTRVLITNRALIEVNQKSQSSHPVTKLPARLENIRVWVADGSVVALFNLSTQPATVHASWAELGLRAGSHSVRNLLDGKTAAAAAEVRVSLPGHGAVIYRVL